ncbi:RNA methyltransferase [Microbacterium nanhaiense]|uniref:RNA methyltransferase n=1 Tax=Microbacterium nanhaiense TaxID=1301026 RepID=A0ABQ2N3T9_9MICO|nr:TfoX/Sxy family protein [Microbacterium nanhaiense]GGO65233.1 RNA methyltransferase [Microbacterium nanhaiense]
MAYNPEIADRVRAIMEVMGDVDEKRMMGSLAFMVNGKMAVGVSGDEVFFPMGGGEALELALQQGAHRLALASGRSVPFAALTDPDDDLLADWIGDAVARALG